MRMAEPTAPLHHPGGEKFGQRGQHAGHAPELGPDRGTNQGRERYPKQRCYAALDLGTNNCRLLIARPQAERFAVIDAFSRIVRLGEGLSVSGTLSDAAMARTLNALHICADKLRRRDVHLSRAVATEACRSARNGAAFVDQVYKETGIALDIISAREEARLAVLGCHSLLDPGDEPALVFDIGGGSTELILVDTRGPLPKMLDWLSVPWGVVSLSETEPDHGAEPTERAANYAAMRARVRESFAPFFSRNTGLHARRLLGTSGTVTTLGSVYLGLDVYDRNQIDGLTVPAKDLRAISHNLSVSSLEERSAIACIGIERADLVVAGCAILEEILGFWPAETVGIADRGIREGILRGLMTEGRTT